MSSKANEFTFQNDMIQQLLANGWLLGRPENYNRELALYSEDLLGFVQEAQWQKFCKLYPNNPEQTFLQIIRDRAWFLAIQFQQIVVCPQLFQKTAPTARTDRR